jgi:hypothetical protein
MLGARPPPAEAQRRKRDGASDRRISEIVPFQLKEREPKEINADVVEERGEPLLLVVRVPAVSTKLWRMAKEYQPSR